MFYIIEQIWICITSNVQIRKITTLQNISAKTFNWGEGGVGLIKQTLK